MKKKPTSPPSPLRGLANPQAIIQHIEEERTGTAPDDLYRKRIEDIMGLLLPEQGDPDVIADATLIRQTSGGHALETVARQTGFIIGFEYCRDLMLSGAAKGGAR